MIDWTVSAQELEFLMDEHLPCQHRHNLYSKCSVEVVSLVTWGDPESYLMCAVATVIVEEMMRKDKTCDHCGRLAKECWRVRPI